MNNRKIGVFDSGVGGLTVLQHLTEKLPKETFIYIGDNLHSPYGEKSVEELKQYTSAIISYFISQDVKMVILACNTTSSTVLGYLRKRFSDLPIIGVVDATAAMVRDGGCHRLAIMATPATIASRAYQTRLGEDKSIGISCPKLVPYIENGVEKKLIIDELKQLLDPWMAQCDGIVLGCTHYPILTPEIEMLYPDKVLYSSSIAVADEVVNYLQMHHMLASQEPGVQQVYTTGDLQSFIKSSHTFFNDPRFEFLYLDLKVA